MQVVAGKTIYTLALIGLCNDTRLRSREQPDVEASMRTAVRNQDDLHIVHSIARSSKYNLAAV
jgi:hypothetical protein